jgi:hypothetical protein
VFLGLKIPPVSASVRASPPRVVNVGFTTWNQAGAPPQGGNPALRIGWARLSEGYLHVNGLQLWGFHRLERWFHKSEGGTEVVDLPPPYIFWNENVAYHPRWRGGKRGLQPGFTTRVGDALTNSSPSFWTPPPSQKEKKHNDDDSEILEYEGVLNHNITPEFNTVILVVK